MQQDENSLSLSHRYMKGEEIANAVTHGIGTGLSIAALVLLVNRAIDKAPPGLVTPYVVGCAVFGASLILLYLMSTLYHALAATRARFVFSILDHSAIYVLIAGTYTGICLTVLYGPLGWILFGIIWFLAVIGVVVYAIWQNKYHWISFSLYLIMGWLVLAIINHLWVILNPAARTFLLAGGIAYTLGCIFFLMKNVRWMHSIWHLFVLAGSISHFFALYLAL